MKYIVFKFIGVEVPVIFPGNMFNHDNIKVLSDKFFNGKPVSAGKCRIVSKDEVYVFGNSFSLGLKSRTKDAAIIRQALNDN